MRPEAPFSWPVVMCSFITMLIRLRRSLEKPACSGAAVGKLAPTTNDATKQKTKRIRMSANLSQRQEPRVRHVTKQWAAELGPAVKPRDNAFREVTHRPRADHRSAQIPVRIAASFRRTLFAIIGYATVWLASRGRCPLPLAGPDRSSAVSSRLKRTHLSLFRAR